jgi:hypothetical protein
MRTQRATLKTTADGDHWIEPDTGDVYPVAFLAYRDKRETQESWPPRHRRLAPDVDHLVWQRTSPAPDVEVVLTVRPGTSPRVQRLVSETLSAIRRGRSASEAIRSVARRFGLRNGRALDVITAGVSFERRPLEHAAGDMFGHPIPQLRSDCVAH